MEVLSREERVERPFHVYVAVQHIFEHIGGIVNNHIRGKHCAFRLAVVFLGHMAFRHSHHAVVADSSLHIHAGGVFTLFPQLVEGGDACQQFLVGCRTHTFLCVELEEHGVAGEVIHADAGGIFASFRFVDEWHQPVAELVFP